MVSPHAQTDQRSRFRSSVPRFYETPGIGGFCCSRAVAARDSGPNPYSREPGCNVTATQLTIVGATLEVAGHLENHHVRLVATFEDGEALFAAVCERGLEGVVAKRLRDPYKSGERLRVKTKNGATARFAEERGRAGRHAARV